MKRIGTIVILLCAFAGMLSGCKRNKDDVKLLNKAELMEYAKDYCTADLTDYVEEQYVHTLYLTDPKTKVEFTVSSSVMEAGLDGNAVGYKAVTHINFISNYAAYINEQIDLSQYHCDRISGNDALLTIDYARELIVETKGDPTEDEFVSLCKEIKEKDVHGFFRTVTLYNKESGKLKYSLEKNEIIKE